MTPDPITIDVTGLIIAWFILLIVFLFPIQFISLISTLIGFILGIISIPFILAINLWDRWRNSQGRILSRLSIKKLQRAYVTGNAKYTGYIEFQFSMYGSSMHLFSALCPSEVEKAMKKTWPRVYTRIEELRWQGWNIEFASKEIRRRPTSIKFDVITYLQIIPPVHLRPQETTI